MSEKQLKYGQCEIIKSKKIKKSKLFGLVFFMLSVALIIIVSDLISSQISGNGSIFFGGKIKIASFNVYALEVGSFETKSEAEAFSNSIKSQGGAGYIYENTKYYVFISMYENLVDAEQIKANLIGQGITANIYNINAPAINLKFSGSNDILFESLSLYKELYKTIYSLSISYDSGETSLTDVVAKLNETKTKLKERINNLSKDSSNRTEKIFIEKSFNALISQIDYLISSKNSNLIFNSDIKTLYFNIIFEYITIARAI